MSTSPQTPAELAATLRAEAWKEFHRCDDAADVIEWYTERLAALASAAQVGAAPARSAAQEEAAWREWESRQALEEAFNANQDGWKLVPKSPTDVMFNAACVVENEAFSNGRRADHGDIWAAMWKAAPPAPCPDIKERNPLTGPQITDLYREWDDVSGAAQLSDFVRLVERSHGIGEKS